MIILNGFALTELAADDNGRGDDRALGNRISPLLRLLASRVQLNPGYTSVFNANLMMYRAYIKCNSPVISLSKIKVPTFYFVEFLCLTFSLPTS